ncbi:MAG: TetR/AcrR family transcriptional regulator [Myxococcota bacterium]|nr:TetR/AcrR family transcriptional regulator [Myxococcota bacterium]
MTLDEYRTRRAERKRGDIIRAARLLFASEGVEGASMAEIAKEAAVSTATLYRHFEDKEQLFSAVVDELVAAVLPDEAPPEAPPREALTEISLRYGQLLSDPEIRGLVRAVVSARGSAARFRTRLGRRGKSIFARAFSDAIRRLRRDGALDPDIDVDRARSELQGMIEHYTLVRGLLFDERPSKKKLRDQVEGCVETWFARWGKR